MAARGQHGDVLAAALLHDLDGRHVLGHLVHGRAEHAACEHAEERAERDRCDPLGRLVADDSDALGEEVRRGDEDVARPDHAVEEELHEEFVRAFADDAAGPGAEMVHAPHTAVEFLAVVHAVWLVVLTLLAPFGEAFVVAGIG